MRIRRRGESDENLRIVWSKPDPALDQKAGEPGELEKERRRYGQDGQETEPDPEVAARRIKP